MPLAFYLPFMIGGLCLSFIFIIVVSSVIVNKDIPYIKVIILIAGATVSFGAIVNDGSLVGESQFKFNETEEIISTEDICINDSHEKISEDVLARRGSILQVPVHDKDGVLYLKKMYDSKSKVIPKTDVSSLFVIDENSENTVILKPRIETYKITKEGTFIKELSGLKKIMVKIYNPFTDLNNYKYQVVDEFYKIYIQQEDYSKYKS